MRISPDSARLSWHLFRLPYALVVLMLAAGCHSTQVAYQFRPAAPLAAAPTVTPDSVAAVPATEVATAPAKLARTKARQPRQVRQLRRVVAQALVQQQARASVSRSAAQSARHAARPHQTAEVGLGTTVLGVLGLIVLPISLIGLLIWGGPVWAILAGLAALAVLIAYLDPFG